MQLTMSPLHSPRSSPRKWGPRSQTRRSHGRHWVPAFAGTNGETYAFRFLGCSRPLSPRWLSPPPLSPRPFAAARLQLDRTVRDGHAEGCPDRALDQPDLAAMGADELGGDGEPEPGAAGAGRALKRLEQVRARLLGNAGAG